MMKIKLTEEQFESVAEKIFMDNFPDKEFGEFKEQSEYVRAMWIRAAYEAIDKYNQIVKIIDFPDISIVKNCCLICKHVDLYRPACNLRGDDISLECVCGKFELFEFEDEDKDEDEDEAYWERIRMSEVLNEHDYHY